MALSLRAVLCKQTTFSRGHAVGSAPLGLSIVLLVLVLMAGSFTTPQPANAAATGYRGWCTGLPPLGSGNVACFPDPMAACQAQFEAWAWIPPATFVGYTDTAVWSSKGCAWDRNQFGGPLPGGVSFECQLGYKALANGTCVNEQENIPVIPPDDDCGNAENGNFKAARTPNPIDVLSGAKLFQAEDFRTADNSLILERLYNSRTYSGTKGSMFREAVGLGNNWRFAFQLELHISGSVDWLEVLAPNGTNHPFTRNSSGAYVPDGWPTGGPRFRADYTVEYQGTWPSTPNNILLSSSQWKVRDAQDRTWILQTIADPITTNYRVARPISLTFRGGLQWTFGYGTNNQLTSITDSYGKSITFNWILRDNTASGGVGIYPRVLNDATLPDGSKLKYLFDTQGGSYATSTQSDRLIGVEHRDASNNLLDSTTYLYENADFPWHLTGIKDGANTRRWTVEYNSSGRAVTSKGPNDANKSTVAYGAVSNYTTTRTVTNVLGKSTVFNYYYEGGNAYLQSQQGQASASCPSSTATYNYTNTPTLSSVTDEEGRVTSYTRNSAGQPTQIVEGYGTASAKTTSITWHSTFRVPTQTVQSGLTTDYTWNTSGQLTQVTQTDTTSHTVPYSTNGQTRSWAYTYDTFGSLLTANGPLSGTGDTVTYTYNTAGYLASVTNEVSHTTTVTAVDGRGLPTTIIDANNVTTNLTYDSERRLKTWTVDPSGLSAVTTIDYNVVGDVIKVTRPNGAYLQYTYDDGRRITKVEDNSGAYVEYDRDNLGNATARRIKDSGGTLQLSQTAAFDELGRLLKFIGASNQTWTHAYDKTSNRVAITDPRANVFGWTFDSVNRLIGTTDEDSYTVTLTRNGRDEITNYSDPRSLNTSFVRNGFGDVIQRTSPDTGATVYAYNALGKPTQITDGRGVVTNLTYDNAGRLLTKQYPAATSENITYTWDATAGGNKGKGRVTKVEDASGSVEWTFNALGQVTQEKKTTSSMVYTVGYAYDLDGNTTQTTYPSGRTVSYSRGSTGLVTGVTTKATPLSSVVTLASGASYQPFGPLQTLTYGNGLILWKTFTQDYNLNTLIVEQGTTSVVDRGYSYWYDDFNITNIWDNNVTARTENYVYTPNQWMQNAYGDWGTLTYWQDGVGNRTHDIFDNGTATTTKNLLYPYNTNQVGGITEASATIRTITHDGAGNIITDVRGATTYNYRYNKRGRLDRLTVGSTVKADYVYDGLERMAVRVTQNMTPAATTHYIYDRAGRLLVEATGTGTVQREYVWIDDTPLALFADLDTGSPKQWYVHPDHLDRPTKMTDGSKAVVWDAYYWPYGEARSITGTATNNLRFPGQYFLVESGLHYNWHRHYDPTLGRYIQADPVRDTTSTRPVNLDGSPLIQTGGISGGSKLALSVATSGDFSRQIGMELPEFVDGPSVYAYARSAPTLNIDPTGEASRKDFWLAVVDMCLFAIGQITGNPEIRARPRRPLPEVTRSTAPPSPPKPISKGPPTVSPPDPPVGPPTPPAPPVSH